VPSSGYSSAPTIALTNDRRAGLVISSKIWPSAALTGSSRCRWTTQRVSKCRTGAVTLVHAPDMRAAGDAVRPGSVLVNATGLGRRNPAHRCPSQSRCAAPQVPGTSRQW